MPKKSTLDEPLTNEEREFAEFHHHLVYKYLHNSQLFVDDFYDIAVFGYLKEVKTYLSQERLQKYAFSTIAYKKMFREVGAYNMYCNRQKRIPKESFYSLEHELGKNFCLQDTIPSDFCVEDIVLEKESIEEIIKSTYGNRLRKEKSSKRIRTILGKCY